MANLKDEMINLLRKIEVTKPSLKKEINKGTQDLIKFPDLLTKKQAQDLFYALIFRYPNLVKVEDNKNKDVVNNFLLKTELLNDTNNKTYLTTLKNFLEELGFGKPTKEATHGYKNGKF